MDYLSNVRFDKALRIEEGVFAHNYSELLTAIKIMDDSEFNKRFNKGKTICEWIRANYGDEVLLLRLEFALRRKGYVRIIERRIKQLEQERKPAKQSMPFYVNIVFFVMFAIVLLSFLYYAYNNDEDSAKKYSDENAALKTQLDYYAERIAFLENQNKALKEELSIKEVQIIPIEAATPAPRDRIKLEDISVRNYWLIIYINSSYLAEFTDTGSMLPVLSSESIGIQIVPQNETDIHPGDIVSYALIDGGIIIHRVIEVGYDSEGWYAYTKGDNNLLRDKDKVRFFQIQRVLVGVLY